MDSEAKEGPACVVAMEEVLRALSKMRCGKAAGQSSVVSEMLQASGEVSIDWLTDKGKYQKNGQEAYLIHLQSS